LLLLANGIAWIGLLASYLSPYIDPSVHWYFALPGLAHFWLLLVNCGFVLAWLFLRWKFAVAGAVLLAVGYNCHVHVFSPFGSPSAPENNERSFRLMTYNVQLFKLYNWTKNKEIRNQMLEYIVSEKCDVLCLQEYFYADKQYFNTTDTLLQIQPATNHHFEAGIVRNGNHYFGLATFSRFPITGKGVIPFNQGKDHTNLAMYTDLLIHDDTIRVYNVHLASNHLDTKQVDDILEGSERSWITTRHWLRKLRQGYKLRSAQIRKISASIQASPYPVVVCGDFNDVPVSYTYRTLSKGLRDAFLGSGEGLGATYNGRLPNLRIDYILHSPGLSSHSFSVPHQGFTDHFPVVCTLSADRK